MKIKKGTSNQGSNDWHSKPLLNVALCCKKCCTMYATFFYAQITRPIVKA